MCVEDIPQSLRAAMECRVCAEDAENNFFPSPGAIVQLREPSGPGVRVDSGIYPGWTVPLDYDPLLAKLVVWDEDRDSAIRRVQRALHEYSITGVETNLAFFREVMDDPIFRKGWLHTGFVADFFARREPKLSPPQELELAAGDWLLVCCDGLTAHLDTPDLEQLLRGAQSAHDLSRQLVDLADERGGSDNCTVVVASCY